MRQAWPIEEVWLRPVLTLAVAALLPFVTARVIAALTLPPRLPADPREVARVLAPFRVAATIAGVVQIQLAWMLGTSALGPALVDRPEGPASLAFGAVAAVLCFVAGAPARAIERAGERAQGVAAPPVLAAMALRLRLVPWLSAPVLVAQAVASLPLVSEGRVDLAMAALAWVLTLVGVAFSGVLLSVLVLALRPASPALRARAERAAQLEGVPLLAVLRLPTHGVRLANAAALPWARTMIVTDHIVELLDAPALDAVLAHEAAHLSEAPWVAIARLGTIATLLFTFTSGAVILDAVTPAASSAWLVAAAILAVLLLRRLLALARRMEERADEHARGAVSPDALADALLALADDAGAPLVTGRAHARLHPDLYDRIVACGRDLGPRPAPPARRPGWIAGLVVALGLGALPLIAEQVTRIEPGTEATTSALVATWRLRVDPWDPSAMLALAWAAALQNDTTLAAARAVAAQDLGAHTSDVMEIESELLARRGDCARARASFDESLRARAAERFAGAEWQPIELGGYHLPPSLVSRCGLHP